MNYKNILVPIDFSRNSIDTFDFALKLGLQDKSRIHLLHIIDPLGESGLFQREDLINLRIRNANEELDKYINEIPHPGIEIIGALRSGKPGEMILNYCKEQRIDLVVIASHGWTGSNQIIMGNVARDIMQSANIPVTCFRTIIKKENLNLNPAIIENWIGSKSEWGVN